MKIRITALLLVMLMLISVLPMFSVSAESVTDYSYTATDDEVTTDPAATTATESTDSVEKPEIPAYDKQKYRHIAGDMTNWEKASYDDEISFYLEAGTYEFSIYYSIHASYGPYGSSFQINDDIQKLALTTSPDKASIVAPVDGVYTFSHFFNSGVVYLNVTYPENAPDVPEYVEFDYTVDAYTNEATITDYIGTARVVEVPQYIDGYPVTAIGSGAFYATFVEKVILPEGLKTIGTSAFGHCTDLIEVYVPDSVTDIGASAFFYCPNLLWFDFPAGVTVINESTFQYCYDLDNVVIPEGVTELKTGAFDYDYMTNITLPKSLKKIEANCFMSGEIIADVYYNGSEKDWAEIEIGGSNNRLLKATIHFAEEDTLPLIPEEEPSFSGASLTLQDNISINFKVSASLFLEIGYKNPYVVYEMNGIKHSVVDFRIVNDKYVFDFKDIAPDKINDTLKATLHAEYNGVDYISETREYSVATYCYNMLNKYTDPAYREIQTLLVDLLNYGAMSQKYTGHNKDNPVNSKLTDAQKAWGTSETPTYETVQNVAYKTIENPTVTWKGGGLNLVDAVTMRFKITADSYENLEVKVETDDRIWTIPYEEFSETTGGYYVYFSGLNAGEMSEPVYLTVYENDEAVSNTLSYSIESYAYSKQNSTDTNLTNLLEAMMKYGKSAYKYAN